MMADNIAVNEKSEQILTDKEKEFLEYLDEEFKDRYTEADEEYKRVWETDLPNPPILLDFDRKSDRNHDNFNRDRRQRRYHPFYHGGYNRHGHGYVRRDYPR